jgi:lipopolysaccharide transport system ATP-binding protein
LLEAQRYNYEELWALKGVTLSLGKGESLGIIGPNGSGKSTLLKLLAGVMKPTKGEISTAGSVAQVLELGIGFHDDLTVTENAVIYGVIMGLKRSEMKERAELILEFAGLTRFKDARLKHLSSGMRVRLAFSIVVQLPADVFLLDEALAVGDAEFQERCFATFNEFKGQGRSLVFVSHNLELVKRFCEKTLYLAKGEPRFFGSSKEATKIYADDVRSMRSRPL